MYTHILTYTYIYIYIYIMYIYIYMITALGSRRCEPTTLPWRSISCGPRMCGRRSRSVAPKQ